MPKDRCVICLHPFRDMGLKRQQRWEEKGNFCTPCNLRAYRVVTHTLTQEESDREVRELRRKNKKLKV